MLLGEVALGDQEPACVLAHFKNLRFLGSPREKKMSNIAVQVQSFDAKDPFAGLALVTNLCPKQRQVMWLFKSLYVLSIPLT